MWICKVCGKVMENDQEICAGCGAKRGKTVPEPRDERRREEVKRNRKKNKMMDELYAPCEEVQAAKKVSLVVKIVFWLMIAAAVVFVVAAFAEGYGDPLIGTAAALVLAGGLALFNTIFKMFTAITQHTCIMARAMVWQLEDHNEE